MCESYNAQYNTNFKCLMPCNTYGPNDDYNEFTSHFYPALIKKIYDAKKNKSDVVKFVSYSNKLKPEIDNIYKKLEVNEHTRMKSSYKFCVVASGEFDGYVAEPRAYEWDVAAGHALLENAGGIVTDFDGNEILYGKRDFKNPSIILKRSQDLKN